MNAGIGRARKDCFSWMCLPHLKEPVKWDSLVAPPWCNQSSNAAPDLTHSYAHAHNAGACSLHTADLWQRPHNRKWPRSVPLSSAHRSTCITATPPPPPPNPNWDNLQRQQWVSTVCCSGGFPLGWIHQPVTQINTMQRLESSQKTQARDGFYVRLYCVCVCVCYV